MTVNGNIDLFFKDPETEPVIPGRFSILYLLRRDIRNCIVNRQALWPGAMAVLAGVDLLGKFYAGDDSSGQVGKRFKDFIKKYFQPIAQDDATTIYQLRNALLHSFGLYSEVKRKGRVCKVYHFTLVATNETGPLVKVHPQNADHYLVDLLVLYTKFDDAVAYYLGDLRTDKDLQVRFNDISSYAVRLQKGQNIEFLGATGHFSVHFGGKKPPNYSNRVTPGYVSEVWSNQHLCCATKLKSITSYGIGCANRASCCCRFRLRVVPWIVGYVVSPARRLASSR